MVVRAPGKKRLVSCAAAALPPTLMSRTERSVLNRSVSRRRSHVRAARREHVRTGTPLGEGFGLRAPCEHGVGYAERARRAGAAAAPPPALLQLIRLSRCRKY